jgi:hypothetical protein
VYGRLVMNRTQNEKIRVNHASVSCSHKSVNVCHSPKASMNYLSSYFIFRAKLGQQQSVLRHVELHRDTTLFVDGLIPVIESLTSENNRADATIVVFTSLSDVSN